MKLEQHIAQGTNLIFFIPTSITAIIVNFKNKNIDTKTALVVIISGIIGAVIGSRISFGLDVISLRKYFGFFLIFIAFYEIYSIFKLYIKNKKDNNKV